MATVRWPSTAASITLYSRLENSLNVKHPYIVEPLSAMPDGTVVDGELVALDDDGQQEFQSDAEVPRRCRPDSLLHFRFAGLEGPRPHPASVIGAAKTVEVGG